MPLHNAGAAADSAHLRDNALHDATTSQHAAVANKDVTTGTTGHHMPIWQSAMQHCYYAFNVSASAEKVPPAEIFPASNAAVLPVASKDQHGDRPKLQSRALPAREQALLQQLFCSLRQVLKQRKSCVPFQLC